MHSAKDENLHTFLVLLLWVCRLITMRIQTNIGLYLLKLLPLMLLLLVSPKVCCFFTSAESLCNSEKWAQNGSMYRSKNDDDNLWSFLWLGLVVVSWVSIYVMAAACMTNPFFSLWTSCCGYSELYVLGEKVSTSVDEWWATRAAQQENVPSPGCWWHYLWHRWLHWVCPWDYCNWEPLLKVFWSSPFNHMRFMKKNKNKSWIVGIGDRETMITPTVRSTQKQR